MHILINITAILAIFLMYYYNIYEFIYCCFSLLRRVKGIVKMFEKQFAKYARAVSDERERRSLYRLYCAKLAAAIITDCFGHNDFVACGKLDYDCFAFRFQAQLQQNIEPPPTGNRNA